MKKMILTLFAALLFNATVKAVEIPTDEEVQKSIRASETEAVSGAPEIACKECMKNATQGTLADGKKRTWDQLLPGDGAINTQAPSTGADGADGHH